MHKTTPAKEQDPAERCRQLGHCPVKIWKTQPRGADSWDTACEGLGVDFTEAKPYRGHKHFLVVVCTCSGGAEACPTRTEREVAKALLRDTILRYGLPVSIGSDKGQALHQK